MPFGKKFFRKKRTPVSAFRVAGVLCSVGFCFGCASQPAFPLDFAQTVPAGTETLDSREALRRAVDETVAACAEAASLPKDVFASENLGVYADYLIDGAVGKGLSTDEAKLPISALLLAFAHEKRGSLSRALTAFSEVVYAFPDTNFAAEALYRQGEIYSRRRQFEAAFDCFSALEDSYPASPRAGDAVVQAYLVTGMVRAGVRPLKGGWLPWLKDRTSALKFYDRLYEMAPHEAISPMLLHRKGELAFEISSHWFSFDKTLDAIDAFERLISVYPESELVPDAYLKLARTYESGSVGPDWDQLSARRAINYYTDFYSLYPEHPQAEAAYEKTVELTNLLAANRLTIGDFYYSRHNNLRAAFTFYNEAVTIAPDSPAAAAARERIERIRRGERSERNFVDWLFGRYRNYDAMDYLDAPSLRPLDEMGFRSGNGEQSDADSAAARRTDADLPGNINDN